MRGWFAGVGGFVCAAAVMPERAALPKPAPSQGRKVFRAGGRHQIGNAALVASTYGEAKREIM
jgi:hypothetical protein